MAWYWKFVAAVVIVWLATGLTAWVILWYRLWFRGGGTEIYNLADYMHWLPARFIGSAIGFWQWLVGVKIDGRR